MGYKNNRVPNNVVLNPSILPQTNAKLSTFNLSEQHITTIPVDKLIPIYAEELNPNDHFEITVSALARLMPMVVPTMSNLRLKYFAFFVPNRLVWKDWTKFMGERLYQADAAKVYRVPMLDLDDTNTNSLYDYIGVPPHKKCRVSALPFRAYRKIWNDWFRANQLQDPDKEYDMETSAEEAASYETKKIGKAADYFTSCLPTPEAGEGATFSLTGKAPVNTDIYATRINGTGESGEVWTYTTGIKGVDDAVIKDAKHVQDAQFTHLYADMSTVSGISINQLRQAAAIQVLLENDNYAGELYVDLMKQHFGTTVPDWLIGRSQFLGSKTIYFNQEPIAQMSESATTPLGTLAAQGFAQGTEKLCEVSTVEHGQLIIMACVTGDVLYQQGISRKLTKEDRYDYMFPEFWHLGDQPVFNKEIFVSGDATLDNGVFGYQGRFREYREGINRVSGLLRSGVTGSLDIWHLGEKFTSTPKLSKEFIEARTPLSRVMAIEGENQILLSNYLDIKATRALPINPRPSMLAGRI